MTSLLAIACDDVAAYLVDFLRREFAAAGYQRALVGLSGGIDSATAAALSVRALGAENVRACLMPYKTSAPEGVEHARLVATTLGIEHEVIEITPQIDAYFTRFPDADVIRRGNKMARERMSILFDQSTRYRALVVGTSNKSEILLGYGTLFGDAASCVNPLAPLYKMHVRQLAEHLGVPEVVRHKRPTADLWIGQYDEDELGFSYSRVDELLFRMIDLEYTRERLVADGFDEAFIDKVSDLVSANAFKGRVPIKAEIRWVRGPDGRSRVAR